MSSSRRRNATTPALAANATMSAIPASIANGKPLDACVSLLRSTPPSARPSGPSEPDDAGPVVVEPPAPAITVFGRLVVVPSAGAPATVVGAPPVVPVGAGTDGTDATDGPAPGFGLPPAGAGGGVDAGGAVGGGVVGGTAAAKTGPAPGGSFWVEVLVYFQPSTLPGAGLYVVAPVELNVHVAPVRAFGAWW